MSVAAVRTAPAGNGALRAPPGPPGHWLLGHTRAFERDALGVLMGGFGAYGDVVGFRFGPIRACLLAHPEHVQHVLQKNHRNYDKNAFSYRRLKALVGEGLITSDGAVWQAHRRLAQPAFQRRQLESVAAATLRAADRVADEWQRCAAEGRPTDVHQDMMGAALEIGAEALFGADVRTEARPFGAALNVALAEVVRRIYALMPLPLLVPTPANLRFRRALRRLHAVVQQVIDRRRAEAGARDDLLSALLRGLDGPALRDELVTFLLAGHETTANALVWTFHLLGRHPAVAARLHGELESALGGRAPALEDLPRLAYPRMVLDEAMRLYPPVWVVDRNAIAADVIGGFRIRPRTLVMLSQYVTHRHPTFWPEPERFDPERFAPAAVRQRPRFAYFPFAGGPRSCIGGQLALTEATLLLACLAGRFALSPVAGQPVEPNPSVTLRPRRAVPMHVMRLSPP